MVSLVPPSATNENCDYPAYYTTTKTKNTGKNQKVGCFLQENAVKDYKIVIYLVLFDLSVM